MAGQRRARIDVNGRADFLRDHWKGYVLGMEDAVVQFKMIHRKFSKFGRQVERIVFAILRAATRLDIARRGCLRGRFEQVIRAGAHFAAIGDRRRGLIGRKFQLGTIAASRQRKRGKASQQ